MLKTNVLWIVSILCLSSIAQGLEVKWSYAGLSQKEIESTKVITQEALELLPPSFKRHLDKTVNIRYADMTTYGDSRGNSIRISNKLKGHILAGRNRSLKTPVEVSSKHATIYQIALGTIIHELAHQYDFHKTYRFNGKKSECNSLSSADNMLPLHCVWNSYKNNISDNPQFLYSLAWNEKKFKGQYLVTEDDSTVRSPNPYEFKSPEEAFAVNFEFFTMDPEFKCRRPTVYNYLSQHFGYKPFSDYACGDRDHFLVTVNNSKFSGLFFEKIDKSRIASIHYLLAGDGNAMMSQWGHSMLRLVICAPERTVISESECISDVAYHRVVSYRAGVTDVDLDSLKGLKGDYPSRLYVMPLLNIINEYTKIEMRELISYPLTLNRNQIRDFITRVQEQNWSYRGRYYFTNNNCASETFNLIRNIVPENIELASREIHTPKSLRDALFITGVAQASEKFKNRLSKYYWPSKRFEYQKHIDNISKASGFFIKDVVAYFALPKNKRDLIFEDVLKTGESLASLYVLTDLMHERLEMVRNSAIMQFEKNNKSSEVIEKIQNALSKEMNTGSLYFKETYGLPTNREVEIMSNIIMQDAQKIKRDISYLEKKVEDLTIQLKGQDFLDELNKQKQNKELIKKTIITKRRAI